MSKITKDFRISALRNGVVVRSAKTSDTATALTTAAAIEMANLGFQVNPDQLAGMSTDSLEKMLEDTRTVIGADRNTRPVYPGFPQQVQELSTMTLIVEQLVHYWSAGTLLPNYPDVVREGLPLEDMARNARKVNVFTASEAAKHFIATLTTRGVALSSDDKALLEGSVALARPSLEEVGAVLKNAKNGENMQSLVLAVFSVSNFSVDETVIALAPYCNSADQLLRLILAVSSKAVVERADKYDRAVLALSDRDANSLKMSNMSRPARRAVIKRLEEVTKGFKADSLVTKQNLWRRVMRMVHPYDFSLTDGSKRAADIIHSNVEYATFNSLVEDGMAKGDVEKVVALLADHQPGNLLRKVVAILRLVDNAAQVEAMATALRAKGSKSAVTTLISAYNGVIAANDKHARVTRVSGLNNTMRETDARTIDPRYIQKVSDAIEDALVQALATKDAPTGVVGIANDQVVPLVRRDAATSDRVLDRGQVLSPVGEGDTVRLFGHWNNNQRSSGYMDIGAVVLDAEFDTLNVVTWDTWAGGRDWATYSGDKCVSPGDNAAEYIDVDLPKLRKAYPKAAWVAMTIQSWSGFVTNNVDMIAGAMLRSKPNSGEVFDARTVATAFKPTTESFQSVPLAINLHTGEMVWLDSSSGSMQTGVSANRDDAVGPVVYDEIARPRMTMGQLAGLWAKAHKTETVDEAVNRDDVLGLLD